ncbi:MAG: DUF2075 domain-containing protein [Betaproteobacteria bacterium]|nr:DUF2075 domain-containing protein [Betaproteobacteria bacterium]
MAAPTSGIATPAAVSWEPMEDAPLYDRYGWQSPLGAFSRAEPRVVRLQLQKFVTDASPEQVRAWDQSIPWLQRECRELEVSDSDAHEYTAILEYELPRDSRRPDVIVLERGCITVLEIKGALHPTQAALDQAFGYARDLRAYHAACADRDVTPVLVVRGGGHAAVERDGVFVVGPEGVDALLAQLSASDEAVIDPQAFLAHDAYAPLPTIVQAARELFQRRELPMIKRARAATDPALHCISEIAREAARTSTHHLVLLSGVPGSGKTLVGLQLVHAHWLDDLAVPRASGRSASPAVYLSGNGPLVQVLQDALQDAGGGGKAFVQGIKEYVKQHARPGRPVPPEHLIVFDEAQRAHDAERGGLRPWRRGRLFRAGAPDPVLRADSRLVCPGRVDRHGTSHPRRRGRRLATLVRSGQALSTGGALDRARRPGVCGELSRLARAGALESGAESRHRDSLPPDAQGPSVRRRTA